MTATFSYNFPCLSSHLPIACIARSDLAIEAELLASLQHPNIIKLRGMAHLGAAGFSHGPRCVALLFPLPPRSSPSTDDTPQRLLFVDRSSVRNS